MTDLIVLGRIDESFHQVAAAVVEEVLVRLGHAVQVREGPHQQMYPLLARGELQLFADSWLPGGHGTYWEQIRDRVVEVAPLFDGARFFWAVPGYVPADLVSALPDLTRPEVTGRMATLVVQGTTPGAGLTMRSQQLVRDYGLDEADWRGSSRRPTARRWWRTATRSSDSPSAHAARCGGSGCPGAFRPGQTSGACPAAL